MAVGSDQDERRSLAQAGLGWVARRSAESPVVTLVLAIGLAVLACGYTWHSLKFKTDRGDLIDPKADYQQRYQKFTQAFGDANDMVVVVEGKDPEPIKQALDELGPLVERESQLFMNVFYKIDTSRLQRKGLQYLSPDQLQVILENLDDLTPVLHGKWQPFTLTNFCRELRRRLEGLLKQPPETAEPKIEQVLQQSMLLAESLNRFAADPKDYESPWLELVPLDRAHSVEAAQVRYLINERGTMAVLKAQPIARADDFSGATPSVNRMRELMRVVAERHPDVRLTLTGIPVLENDEMREAQNAMTWSSVISFFGVAVLMVWGFRGAKYPLLAQLMLCLGMAYSFGFTTAVIGHLNILSVSFAATLMGLGIDFGIVFLAHYAELRHDGHSLTGAIEKTAIDVGPGIVTAGLTASVAFFVAVFTDFRGVAELGIIACGGILLCLVAAFTSLPAMLALFDRKGDQDALPRPYEWGLLKRLVTRRPWWVLTFSCLIMGLLARYLPRVYYDYNLLHMQAEGLESVAVQKRIFEQFDNSLLFAVSLADSPQQALELKRKFEALPTVNRVDELASMWPPLPESETRLAVQAVRAHLGQLPKTVPPEWELDPANFGKQMQELLDTISPLQHPEAAAAKVAIDQLLDALDKLSLEGQLQVLTGFQPAMKADLLDRLKGLYAASDPEPVSVADLPQPLATRFVSSQGDKWLLQVYPKAEIWDDEPLGQFIADIRSVDTDVTGTPLQTFEASHQIKDSYELAGVYAFIAVCLLLFLDFRSLTESLLALLPPIAGSAIMFGVLGCFNLELNPANLIVIPLILGIGVDGGVHIVHFFRMQAGRYKLLSSTITAIMMTSTTTIVGFASLLIARHHGLFSLGLVLSIGVTCCLYVSLLLLPSILTLISRWRFGPAPDDHPHTASSLVSGYTQASMSPLVASGRLSPATAPNATTGDAP